MKLHYQIFGAGKPLIIVHGLFGCSDNWRGIAKQLSASAQVITVDLRNHGRSPHHAQQNYALMADDLAELLDDLNIAKADFIGHSIGGKVVMTFCQYYPSYCDRLIVVDIAPKQYQPEHTIIFDALLQLDLSRYSKRSEVDTALSTAIKIKSVRQFLLMNVVMGKHGLAWRINLPALADNYSQLLQAVPGNMRVSVPTLFIRGGRSSYMATKDHALISQIFTQYELCTIGEAGHWVHAEAPQPFLSKVRAFLNYD